MSKGSSRTTRSVQKGSQRSHPGRAFWKKTNTGGALRRFPAQAGPRSSWRDGPETACPGGGPGNRLAIRSLRLRPSGGAWPPFGTAGTPRSGWRSSDRNPRRAPTPAGNPARDDGPRSHGRPCVPGHIPQGMDGGGPDGPSGPSGFPWPKGRPDASAPPPGDGRRCPARVLNRGKARDAATAPPHRILPRKAARPDSGPRATAPDLGHVPRERQDAPDVWQPSLPSNGRTRPAPHEGHGRETGRPPRSHRNG